jgi:DNA-binding CsgD family transcriptional regulator
MRLSPREREVFLLFLAGHRQKEIACRLGLSPKTVHTYLLNIRRREQCEGTVALLLLGLRSGLLAEAGAVCPVCGASPFLGLSH